MKKYIAELIGTFVLVFGGCGTAVLAGDHVGYLGGIPVTNTSVNPARSISQAIFVGAWAIDQLWLFIVAPIIGAVIASLVFGAIGTASPIMSTQKAERALDSEVAERRG
jgi:aquaporin Z